MDPSSFYLLTLAKIKGDALGRRLPGPGVDGLDETVVCQARELMVWMKPRLPDAAGPGVDGLDETSFFAGAPAVCSGEREQKGISESLPATCW